MGRTVVAVALGLGLGLGLGMGWAAPPAIAQQATAVDDCPPPAGTGDVDDGTLTNRLIPPATIPDPVRLGLGSGPERYAIELETRLRGGADALRAAPNFDVIARLTSSNGETVSEDAFVATAAARNQRSIEVRVCLDPQPPSGGLDAGTYRAQIEFIDPRIPETTLSFEVWVGGAAGASYLLIAVALGAAVVAALPAAVAIGAVAARRPWRAELRVSLPWLLPLLAVTVVAYTVAAALFLGTDRYHLWSVSVDGASELLGYVIGRVTIVVTAVTALLAVVPRWREAWGRLLARAAPTTTPLPTPATTETPTPTPTPIRTPRPRPVGRLPAGDGTDGDDDRDRLAEPVEVPAPVRLPEPDTGVAHHPPPVLAWRLAAAAIGLALAASLVVVALTVSDGQPGVGSEDGSGGNGDPPDTTIGDPPLAAAHALADLEVGETPGDEAVDDLRDAGFVVLDYEVCSDIITDPDLLAGVRETDSRRALIDIRGSTAAADDVAPPALLDVDITTGDPCS